MSVISVVGSINVDLVVKAQRRPSKGETIFGENFSVHPGGKGANQAVAIARLGGDVRMLGCVGDDIYGEAMIENLRKNGVNTEGIRRVENISTGVASIVVAENDNSIIVVKAANEFVDVDYIKSVEDKILKSDFVLMQYEIPMETVEYVVELCHKNNIKVILNPAPINKLSEKAIGMVDYIIPNEHEAVLLFEGIDDLETLLRKHPNKIIATLGEKGAAYCDRNVIVNIPVMEGIKVVDTTGAGDTFSGAFAKAISENMDIEEAVKFAQCAAGMSVEKFGAQEGMPTLEDLKSRLE